MYKTHPVFEQPEENAKIWRYMDFVKFLWMIDHQCLYFTNVNKFKIEDPFEGSCIPSELLKNAPVDVAKYFVNQMNTCGPPITVNCWHLNDCESAAMWKLYTGENKGIAIQSTFNRMVKAFEKFPDSVHIGKIRYINYQKETFKGNAPDKFEPILTKRKSFEHERELRAVIWETSRDTPRTNDGSVLANVNLKELIENIYIFPFSPFWHRESAQAVVKKFGLDVPVLQSELDKQPLY
jgi:hypothetical protein